MRLPPSIAFDGVVEGEFAGEGELRDADGLLELDLDPLRQANFRMPDFETRSAFELARRQRETREGDPRHPRHRR